MLGQRVGIEAGLGLLPAVVPRAILIVLGIWGELGVELGVVLMALIVAVVVVADAGCFAFDHPLWRHKGEGQLTPDVAMAWDGCPRWAHG